MASEPLRSSTQSLRFLSCLFLSSFASACDLVCLMVPAEPTVQHPCLRMLRAFLVYHSLVPILEGLVEV